MKQRKTPRGGLARRLSELTSIVANSVQPKPAQLLHDAPGKSIEFLGFALVKCAMGEAHNAGKSSMAKVTDSVTHGARMDASVEPSDPLSDDGIA